MILVDAVFVRLSRCVSGMLDAISNEVYTQGGFRALAAVLAGIVQDGCGTTLTCVCLMSSNSLVAACWGTWDDPFVQCGVCVCVCIFCHSTIGPHSRHCATIVSCWCSAATRPAPSVRCLNRMRTVQLLDLAHPPAAVQLTRVLDRTVRS